MAKRNRKKIGDKNIFERTFFEGRVKKHCRILSHILVTTFHQWDALERVELSSDLYLNNEMKKNKGLVFLDVIVR